MSLQEDLIKDISTFFGTNDFAEKINYVDLNGNTLKDIKAVFNDSDFGLNEEEYGESSLKQAIVSLPVNISIKPEKGIKIYRQKTNETYEIVKIVTSDDVSFEVSCEKKSIRKINK